MSPRYILLALAAFAFVHPVQAQEPTDYTLGITTWSAHSLGGRNSNTFGLYGKHENVVIGGYCSSESESPAFPNQPKCRVNVYAGKSFTYKFNQTWDTSLLVGAVRGYMRSENMPLKAMPFALPSIGFTSDPVTLRLSFAPHTKRDTADVVNLGLEFPFRK